MTKNYLVLRRSLVYFPKNCQTTMDQEGKVDK